jgi:hypothetical protein
MLLSTVFFNTGALHSSRERFIHITAGKIVPYTLFVICMFLVSKEEGRMP